VDSLPACELESGPALRRRLADAIEGRRPFAVGKIGPSELHWMAYPILRESGSSAVGMRLFERQMFLHGVKNAGIFPAERQYYLDYNATYVRDTRNLDSIGVFLHGEKMERIVVAKYELTRLTHYLNHEPNRSTPDRPEQCYLPLLRDKKILIVCPFAELLRERAQKEVFEAVWAKTGKKWFHPGSIDAVEFPYGVCAETRQRYASASVLIDEINREISRRDFDVALIGAAGMAIPIASYVKSLGRIAIDLGGHLQVLFGVIGKRWREQEEWRERYFNDAWIDMPARYRPAETDVCDRGAYW
jgi:hypothetical protein